MPEIIYLNGKLVSPADAVISIDDRGFLFGDAVYEVVSSYDGRLWALERHMRRLRRSLAAIELDKVEVDEVRDAVRETYRASEFPAAIVYIQITRGVQPRSHVYARDLQPTVLITARDASPLRAAVDPDGISAVTTADLRWRRCDVKSTNLLPNVVAKTRAHEHGAGEAILVDPDGYITEGSSTSVFWVENNRLSATPAGPEVLPGVTAEFIIEIARDEGIPLLAERVALEQFRRANEILLTGTITEVCPVVELDGAPVGSGGPGPVTLRLRQSIQARIAAGDDALR